MTAIKAFREDLPSEIDSQSASQLRTILAGMIEDDERDTPIQIGAPTGETATVVLTHGVAQAFLDVLRLISSGHGFQIIPFEAELTTQQAADFLNVSRPYLIKLLENKDIEFSKVGRHRRIKAQDLFAYKAKRDAKRADALGRLAKIDLESGLL